MSRTVLRQGQKIRTQHQQHSCVPRSNVNVLVGLFSTMAYGNAVSALPFLFAILMPVKSIMIIHNQTKRFDLLTGIANRTHNRILHIQITEDYIKPVNSCPFKSSHSGQIHVSYVASKQAGDHNASRQLMGWQPTGNGCASYQEMSGACFDSDWS